MQLGTSNQSKIGRLLKFGLLMLIPALMVGALIALMIMG
jgi:hypothetical protein